MRPPALMTFGVHVVLIFEAVRVHILKGGAAGNRAAHTTPDPTEHTSGRSGPVASLWEGPRVFGLDGKW